MIPQCFHIVSWACLRIVLTLWARSGERVNFSCGKLKALDFLSGFTALMTWLLKTMASSSEFDARRFAPWTPVQADSPKV